MPEFRTVIFDCDSTLSRIEGVEALASEYRSEVAALTEAAMSGAVPLEQVYGRRLDLIQPTMADLERVGRQYVAERVPGVEDTMAKLRREVLEGPKGGSSKPGEGFDVTKSGDMRCGMIGVFIGALPGLGGAVSQWLAYGHAVQGSKDKSRFGKSDNGKD